LDSREGNCWELKASHPVCSYHSAN